MGEHSKASEGVLRGQLRLYLVMSMEDYQGRTALEMAAEAIEGGVTMLQLREKDRPWREVLPEARKLRALCREKGIPFIVNDRVDIAILLDADGVHVGQDDLPGVEARRLLGSSKIIGISAGSHEEAQWAVQQGADYLGIGPVYSTATKADAGEAIGTGLLGELAVGFGLPAVGIGGIVADNAACVISAGASGVAVVSAITRQADPKAAAAALRTVVDALL
jgi:thiamine-phosphate pyrophosphorylase